MLNGKKGKTSNSSDDKSRKNEIKVVYKIDDRVIEEDLTNDFEMPLLSKVSGEYIGKVLGEDGALNARWNLLLNEATEDYENKKLDYDIWLAKKFDKYKKILLEEDGKIGSDTKINKAIVLDPEYRQKNREVNESKKNMSNIKAIATSFARKGDKASMIASLYKFEIEQGTFKVKKHF